MLIIRINWKSWYSSLFAATIFFTMLPYFCWNNHLLIITALVLLLGGLIAKHQELCCKRNIYISFIYILLFGLLSLISFFNSNKILPFYSIMCVLLISYYIVLPVDFKVSIKNKFYTLLSIIFTLGMIEYVLINFNLLNPIMSVIHEAKAELSDYGIFNVYFFNIKPSEKLFFRFQSIFDEPGVVGTICGLIINTLSLKRDGRFLVIFIISGVLSLSLAFYFYLFIFLLRYRQIKVFVLLGSIVSFGYFFFYEYVDQYIISRISVDDNRGFSGNNRTTSYFNSIFNEYIASNDVFIGKGIGYSVSLGEGVSSWKMLVLDYGIVGFSCIIAVIWYIYIYTDRNKQKPIVVLFLFIICFFQRSLQFYLPAFAIILTSFTCKQITRKTGSNF